MTFIDLSHPLEHGQGNFPRDPKISIIPHCNVQTATYNLSQISMSTHQGTHLDAMYHFLDDGKTLDQMPLEWFYGPTHVLRIPKPANGEITVEDLLKYDQFIVSGARLIIDTGWHKHFGADDYFTDFPSLTLDAAKLLADRYIRLLGMDMPTPGKEWYELHHILLPKEIVIVESVANLDKVPDQFIFIGFPLNIKGRDGSPIRAVAMVS